MKLAKLFVLATILMETGLAWAQLSTATLFGPGGLDGRLRVNTLNGPGIRDVDASLFRDFTLHERVKFQFRGEAINVFNFFNPSNPGVTLNSLGSAGIITGGLTLGNTGGARVIQVGGRLLW